MKKYSIFLILILISLGCKAQQIKLWTDGPLTWYDFEVASPVMAQSDVSSFAAFTLVRENKTVKTNGITYKYQDVTAAITRNLSWVKSGQMTDANLQRHQKEFDILQYFANIYREDYLFYNDTLSRRHEMWFDGNKDKLSEAEYLDLFNAAVEEFHRTGDASAYPVSNEPFDITKQSYSVTPDVKELQVLLTTLCPTGILTDYFYGPFVGFTFGYGIRERKNYYNCSLTTIDRLGAGGSYWDISAKYGRILSSNSKTDFSLFAGAGFANWKEGIIVSKYPLFKGPSFTQGLSVDVLLHKTVNYLAEIPQEREQKLNLRLFINEMYDIENDLIIPYIGLAAGINLGMKNLSRN